MMTLGFNGTNGSVVPKALYGTSYPTFIVRPTLNLHTKTVRRLYWKEKKSLPTIGKMLNIDSSNVYRWMKKHRISVRSKKEAALLRRKIKTSKSELYNFYWKKKLSTTEIGGLFGTTGTAVLYWMKKFNIRIRTPSESGLLRAKIKRLTPSKLYALYYIKRRSTSKIAKEAGVCATTVRKWIIDYKIPRKTRSESCRKYKRKSFSGNFRESAYLRGFSLGDLHVIRRCQTIHISTTTTHPAMIKLFHKLFNKYGHCHKHYRKGTLGHEWVLCCYLDNSFDFLLRENEEVPVSRGFYPFLAGYFDAEGWLGITRSHLDKVGFRLEVQTTDKSTLEQIKVGLDKRGFHPIFGMIKSRHKGWKDLYYVRLLRKQEVFKLIKNLLCYSKHQEKIKKMKLAVRLKNKNSWTEIEHNVKEFRNQIKKEVNSVNMEQKSFQVNEMYKRVGLRAGLESQ